MKTLELATEVVVVGSGAGGGAAAVELVQAGREVLILEMGNRELPKSFTQREEQMMPRLFQDAGARTTADKAIQVLQGKGLGGSTLHNLNLCKRIDPELFELWAKTRDLPDIGERLRPHYDHFEKALSIAAVPEDRINRNNQILRAGAEALGWKNGPLRHNRTGCIGSGFCELGCAYDAKNNSAKILIPAAEKGGAKVLTGIRVTQVLHRFGRATGVSGQILDERGQVVGHATIRAERVVLAASATGSAALVIASGLPDPYRQAGRGLTLHPGATVGGVFDEPVDGWKGVPQSWECDELLHPTDPDRRMWLVPVFGHPVATAAMLPGLGPEAVARIGSYRHIAAITPMLHDSTVGRVDARGDARPLLHYSLNDADRRMMAKGVSAAAQVLLAAGAREVLIPTAVPQVVRTAKEAIAVAQQAFGPLDPPLAAVHPMGGMCMGGDPHTSATNADGRHHHCPNLWIADAGLFPTSTGVPPQWSTYSFGRLVGQAAGA